MQRNLRGMVMFAIACIASPCCTPLIVPLVVALLAGTPVALWMSHNLGWVYGALTVISIIGFILAVRWLRKPAPLLRPMDIPVITGDKAHVE